MRDNSGVANTGPGSVTVTNSAVGDGATVHNDRSASRPTGRGRAAQEGLGRCAVGVLTFTPAEMGSFNDMLRRQDGYIERVAPDGSWLPTATIAGVEVMLIQTHRQGSRSAQAAVERLKQWHSPNFIVVAGIAGAIEPTVRIGDVVLADEVVYYDARRIGPAGTRHRGQHLVAPPVVGNRLNAFFAAHRGDFAMAATAGGSFMVRRGLLGSGDAVIADADAEIRLYLADYNDKVLAVETESAGVAQAVYEQPESDSPVKGWMAVRGISDRADPAKSDDAHAMAATHAAAVFAEFVPFLAAGGSR